MWTKLAQRFCLDFAGDDLVLIVGSGRSGTTWLADLINANDEFRYIFEPLNPDVEGAVVIDNWCLSAADTAPNISQTLRGKLIPPWANSVNRKLFARRRLIKEIRMNLMLDWVMQSSPRTKIIKLIRNPMEVAASRKQLQQHEAPGKWLWHPDLSELLNEPAVQAKLNQRQSPLLKKQLQQGMVAETIAMWCLENLLDLHSGYRIYYEDLIDYPARVLPELMRFVGVAHSSQVQEQYLQRSFTDRNRVHRKSKQTNHWTHVLSKDEVQNAQKVLREFAVENLYDDDWQPASRADMKTSS